MGITRTFDSLKGVADLVSLSISSGEQAPLCAAGILRGSAGTLWDFMGFLMAVSAR